MKCLYRLGKALMLPVSCLPIAGILLGLGFWLDPIGYGNHLLLAQIFVLAGSSLLDHMSILFAVGVAFGMADEQDGSAALAGVVAWLIMQYLLSMDMVHMIAEGRIDASYFQHIENQFMGILSGMIGAYCSNLYRFIRLRGPFAAFGGRRFVAIAASGYAVVVSLLLLFIWPHLYRGCIYFGTSLLDTGAVGAGVYAFMNRLLIPTGLHHALNSVFWFDMAGISDLNAFWSSTGVYGQTGQYMTGFFPVMIFGLPGAALAMYHTAYKKNRKMAGGLLLSAAICSVLTGVTEPMEFAFMFLAPGLFFVHAFLTGISGFVCALLPFRIGFNFSAGLLDYVLSLNAPMALNAWLLLPIGLAFGILYYVVFRFCILRFHLKTPGREDEL
ncbi:MAG: PTS transporter subunit EIIC [Lachnospiraceae bacterium]|nr:PTS transporter subunit EIIC [Lachnospiraceae bacterium]